MKWFLFRLQSLFAPNHRQSLTIIVTRLLLGFGIIQPQFAGAAPTCIELFQALAPGRIGNIFASVSSDNAIDYGQPAFRNFDEVTLFFSGQKIQPAIPPPQRSRTFI